MLVFGGVPNICNRHVKETSFHSLAFRVIAVSGVGIMTRSRKTSVYKKIQGKQQQQQEQEQEQEQQQQQQQQRWHEQRQTFCFLSELDSRGCKSSLGWPTHPVSLQVLLTLCESVAMIVLPETNTMILFNYGIQKHLVRLLILTYLMM